MGARFHRPLTAARPRSIAVGDVDGLRKLRARKAPRRDRQRGENQPSS